VRTLKPGDRVRVTGRGCQVLYRRGAKGTVMRGPTVSDTAKFVYYVAMDNPGASGTNIFFHADEIEPDA
jgi:hypothetical protein